MLRCLCQCGEVPADENNATHEAAPARPGRLRALAPHEGEGGKREAPHHEGETFFDARASFESDPDSEHDPPFAAAAHVTSVELDLHRSQGREVNGHKPLASYTLPASEGTLPFFEQEYLHAITSARSSIASCVRAADYGATSGSHSGSSSSDHNNIDANTENDRTSIATLLSGFKPGQDLTGVQLPPKFLQGFSVLQKSEEVSVLEGAIRQWDTSLLTSSDPFDRIKGVLCLHLDSRAITTDLVEVKHAAKSSLPMSAFAKPLNPVLGETHRWSCNNVTVTSEQVGHHPPETAMHVHHCSLGFSSNTNVAPAVRFTRSGSIRIGFTALQEVELLQPACGTQPSWTDTFVVEGLPDVELCIFPSPFLQLVGQVKIKRKCGGERMVVTYKPRGRGGLRQSASRVACELYDSSGNFLEQINGRYDYEVRSDTDSSVLWRCPISRKSTESWEDLHAEPQSVQVDIKPADQWSDSALLWGNFAAALAEKDMRAAAKAKREVDNAQRAYRKAIGATRSGLRDQDVYTPLLFVRGSDGFCRLKNEKEIASVRPQDEFLRHFIRKLYLPGK